MPFNGISLFSPEQQKTLKEMTGSKDLILTIKCPNFKKNPHKKLVHNINFHNIYKKNKY